MTGDTNTNARPSDYAQCICGIIEIDLFNALEWLGNSTTLNSHALFPPVYYDPGYALLLQEQFMHSGVVGSIANVGS